MVHPAARPIPVGRGDVTNVARVLYAAAAALGIMGFGIQFAWPAARYPADPPVPVPLPASPSAAAASRPSPAVFEEIVALNIFSDTRSPPRHRYVPPGAAVDTPQVKRPRRRAPAASSYRLSGVVIAPDDTTAVIDANPRTPGAELYHVGDTIGAYKVRAITDRAVVLDGPDGRYVLRLQLPKGSKP